MGIRVLSLRFGHVVRSALVLTFVSALAAMNASANPIQVNQQFNLNTTLPNGGVLTSTLDVSAALAAQGSGFVQSGTIRFVGGSSAQGGTAVHQSYTAYSLYSTQGHYEYYPYTYTCGPFGRTCTGYNTVWVVDRQEYLRYQDLAATDGVVDEWLVEVGLDSATESVPTAQSTTQYGSQVFDYQSGISYYYTRPRTTTAGDFGPMDVTIPLDAAALAELRADGTLDIRVEQAAGSSTVYYAVLDLVVVPEPTTAFLLGGGLLGLARRGKRRD